MGILEFFVLAVVVGVLAWLAVWVLGKLAPGHPKLLDNLIWFVACLVLILTLLQALGLLGHDPQIPRIG
jgi:hypothetical protein